MGETATILGMAKKKPGTVPASTVDPKAVIYLEVPPGLKEEMDQLARQHNRRLTGECIQALQEYLARHKAADDAGE